MDKQSATLGHIEAARGIIMAMADRQTHAALCLPRACECAVCEAFREAIAHLDKAAGSLAGELPGWDNPADEEDKNQFYLLGG